MNNTVITKDLANRKLNVTRQFNAPLEKVWKAWTDKDLLDKWWAPKPWKAETKTLDFTAGGLWLYAMQGPDGTKMWSRVDIKTVVPQSSFSTACAFSDEDGTIDQNFPKMYWDVKFEGLGEITKVYVELSFDTDAAMQKIIEMGFEGGFTMGLNNLEELLETY